MTCALGWLSAPNALFLICFLELFVESFRRQGAVFYMMIDCYPKHELLDQICSLSMTCISFFQPRKFPWHHLSCLLWDFPPFSFIKINVDGSERGDPGMAGAGIVLRNECGVVLSVKVVVSGVSLMWLLN